jgi:hypothetical protein
MRRRLRWNFALVTMSTELPQFEPTEHPHRRYNPLTKQWVLCSRPSSPFTV